MCLWFLQVKKSFCRCLQHKKYTFICMLPYQYIHILIKICILLLSYVVNYQCVILEILVMSSSLERMFTFFQLVVQGVTSENLFFILISVLMTFEICLCRIYTTGYLMIYGIKVLNTICRYYYFSLYKNAVGQWVEYILKLYL